MPEPQLTSDALARALAPLHKRAFGIATGLVGALVLFLATAVLMWKGHGAPDTGRTLSLLGHFLPGYRVSWPGAFLGGAYGLGAGFVLGWLFAAIKNACVLLALRRLRLRAEREQGQGAHFLDGM